MRQHSNHNKYRKETMGFATVERPLRLKAVVMEKVMKIIIQGKVENNLNKHSWNSRSFCSKSVAIKQSLISMLNILGFCWICNFPAGKSNISHYLTTKIVDVVYGLHNLEIFQEMSPEIEIQKHVKTSFNTVVCVLKDRKLTKGKIPSLHLLYFMILVVLLKCKSQAVNKEGISSHCKILPFFFFYPRRKMWQAFFKASSESCTLFAVAS